MDEQERMLAEEHLHFLNAACHIVRTYNYLGRFDAALNLLPAVESIASFPEAYIERFRFLQIAAELRLADYALNNRGRDEMFALIERIYQKQMDMVEEVSGGELDFTEGSNGNTMDMATALCLLGQAHYYTALNTHGKDYEQTFAYCQQALDIWEKLETERRIVMSEWEDPISVSFEPDEHARNYVLRLIERGMSKTLFYLGRTAEQVGKNEQARVSYQRALDLALHSDAKEEASYAYRHLIRFCEDEEQQLEYALRSLALREEIGFKRTLPHSHLLVCDLYLRSADLEKAQDHCQTAFHLAEAIGLNNPLMMAWYSRGEIAQRLGKRDDARDCFTHCLELAEQLHFPFGKTAATKKLQELN